MSLSLVFQVVSFNGPAIPAPRPQMQVSMDQGLIVLLGALLLLLAVPTPARRGEPARELLDRDAMNERVVF